MSRAARGALVVGTAVVAVVVLTLMLSGEHDTAAERTPRLATVHAHRAAAGRRLADTLAIFGRGQVAADRIPAPRGAALVDTARLLPGEDRSRSRRLALGGDDYAFAWPMRDGVCYGHSPVGGGCVRTARLARRGVELAVVSTVDPRTARYVRSRVLGLARNGIQEVALVLPGGAVVRRTVDDNAFYAANLTAPPVVVRWSEHDGSMRSVRLRGLSEAEIAALR